MIALLGWLACGSIPADPDEHGHEDHDAPADGHEGHGEEVVLGEAALRNARLDVQPVSSVALDGRVAVPARITLDPRREARVSAVTAGTVERIGVRPGDQVKEGGSLATVVSPDLGVAIGAHLSATAKLEAIRARRDRIAGLHGAGFSSKSQLLDADAELTVAMAEAEGAEERLRVFGISPSRVRPAAGEHFASRFSVRSPVAGEVLAIDATLGKSVASGDPLFHVGNLDEVWLLLDVAENHLASIRIGAAVSFSVAAYGSEAFSGTVDQIGGLLDPTSRTIEVRVVVPNPEHRLKPNMFATAQLALSSGAVGEGIVVGADVIQEIEGRRVVFVEEAAGRFVASPVRTETLPDGRLHVLDGLHAGDRIVVGGAFTLKSELEKSALGEGHAH